MLRRVFLEWPAKAISGYFSLYRLILALICLVTLPLTLVALVLWFGFGIRWGW
jgi:hypothetical protein